MIMQSLLSLYRQLPWFKGKLRLGKLLFCNQISHDHPVTFRAHGGIKYTILNTKENLGVELLINGVYERDVVRFLLEQIKDGDCYFDVGANIGSLALPILKKKPAVFYHGFEASPIVFSLLERNIRNNFGGNYLLVNKAVHMDDSQALEFFLSEHYGKSSLAPDNENTRIRVQSVSIDAYCEKNHVQTIDWMKVDVEGFESSVFSGMQHVLSAGRVKNILFEFEAWSESRAGFVVGTAKEILRGHGFMLFDIYGKPWIDSKAGKQTMIWAKKPL